MRTPGDAARRLARLTVVPIVVTLWACQAFAIEFVVEPRQVSVDESVRVTLTLDGELASIDSVDLPLSNLETSGPPSTNSQFTIVNGSMNRKKTFTWWVSPVDPGSATVGPLQLETDDGGLVLVPSVAVSVVPSSDMGASGPAEALDRLYLAGRDEVILVAEASPSNAEVGEEVIVTWTIYSAVSLRGFSISTIPELDSFWVEEDLVQSRSPRSAYIGGHEVQRMDVRRASLFPLRDGQLEIPSLEVRVEVIRPFRDPFGGFGLSEGRVAEVRRRSAPITVTVRPAGVEADGVGRFRLERSDPVVSGEGLVTFDVTMEGSGFLRAMPAPGFKGDVAGEVEIEDVGSDVTGRSPLRMRRVWRYVIFPRESGVLEIPALEATTRVPGSRAARVLTTATVSVDVSLSGRNQLQRGGERKAKERVIDPVYVASALVLLSALVATILLVRWRVRGSGGELRRIIDAAGHTITLRKRLDEAVSRRGINPVLLYGESSELGDAWRASMSLVDRLEKEPESIEEPALEVAARARRLMEELERRS